jgi:RNA polymerase sigma-70 factor (ECF subfamily)
MQKEQITELAAKAACGDVHAFEDLYSANAQTILFHCRNLIVDKNQYEDVAQEVAIALFRNIETLKEPKAFYGWLHRIIRNTCINHNRKFMSEAESKSIDGSEETLAVLYAERTEENPEQYVTDNDVFFAMLKDLPPAQRETLILRYYDGLSYKEIAAAFGSTVSTVSTNLIKAKRALGRLIRMDEYEGDGSEAINGARINNLITAGTNSLIPMTAVSHFVEATSAKVILTTEAARTASTIAAIGGKSALGVGKGLLVGTACAAVVTAGTYGVISHDTIAVDQTVPSSPVASVQQSEQTLVYEGKPHLVFTNEAGEETRRNISSMLLTEEGVAAENAVWVIKNKDKTEVLSGVGKSVTAGLDALPNGAYKAIFTLTAPNGAVAQISRSFFVDKMG